jgi:hypothetical protein
LDRLETPSAPDAAEMKALMSARAQERPKAPAQARPRATARARPTAREPASSSDELTGSASSGPPSDDQETLSAQGVEGQTVLMSAREQE